MLEQPGTEASPKFTDVHFGLWQVLEQVNEVFGGGDMVTQGQTFCASLKQEEKIWGYANHK